MIQTDNLTKVFFNGKGIKNITLQVKPGEVLGFLGPNGAGKSTAIRHLMGFMKADRGTAHIGGVDCWSGAEQVQRNLGYIPGEIAFIDGLSASEHLDLLAGMRGLKDRKRSKELIDRFQLDIRTPVRRMSKGMKQKLAIIAAFMHDPQYLILDEPSSGLDPLMQRTLVELIQEEKRRGKAVLISSHIFSEVEDTADAVTIIKNGEIVSTQKMEELNDSILRKVLIVTFREPGQIKEFSKLPINIVGTEGKQVRIAVNKDFNEIIQALSRYDIANLEIPSLSLEDMFMQYYNTKENQSA